jgi:hypothetical protein
MLLRGNALTPHIPPQAFSNEYLNSWILLRTLLQCACRYSGVGRKCCYRHARGRHQVPIFWKALEMYDSDSQFIPLYLPAQGPTLTNADVILGAAVPPVDRLKIISPLQWEELITEWLVSKPQYKYVGRIGQSGDLGRDVIACEGELGSQAPWDNYQCKYYKDPIAVHNLWPELGKLIYYTFIGAYSRPRAYYIVAPQGPSAGLTTMLQKPEGIAKQLIAKWDEVCAKKITQKKTVTLDTSLQAYIESFDFSTVTAVPPPLLLAEYSKTIWFPFRFGGGLKERPKPAPVPLEIGEQEIHYVRHLLDAYGDYLKTPVTDVAGLSGQKKLREHFSRQRQYFYFAEALQVFARENVPGDDAFDDLQGHVKDAISDELDEDHSDGYTCVKKVIHVARTLSFPSHVLSSRLDPRDLAGICHQLANANLICWVK